VKKIKINFSKKALKTFFFFTPVIISFLYIGYNAGYSWYTLNGEITHLQDIEHKINKYSNQNLDSNNFEFPKSLIKKKEDFLRSKLLMNYLKIRGLQFSTHSLKIKNAFLDGNDHVFYVEISYVSEKFLSTLLMVAILYDFDFIDKISELRKDKIYLYVKG
jgi:hypothetical protein